MQRLLPCVVALLAFAALPVSAQQDPAAARFPLRKISIEGNHYYSADRFREATGLKIGEMVNKATFEEARDRLVATGVLETVAFEFGPTASGDGYQVTFEVAEIEQIYPVRFENIDVPAEDLYAWLRQKDPLFVNEVPGTERLIERYAGYIEEYLAQQGKPREIRGELTADKPEELYIMFHPKDAMPVVAEVDFEGNEIIPEDVLRNSIDGVAVGARYTEGRFRMLLTSSVRPIYEARGRIGVRFPTIKTGPAGGDVNGIKVTVTVVEGESYNFGKLFVKGTASMDQDLYDLADIKSGDVANMTAVIDALDHIRQRMKEKGYMEADASAHRAVDEDARTVDIYIDVVPGPQYGFGELTIQGLDLHGEFAVRKMWGMLPGAPFDAAYPDFFLGRIRDAGVFDNLKKTSSEIKVNDDAKTVDVVLIFNPEPEKEGILTDR